jgi:hypothetical protein
MTTALLAVHCMDSTSELLTLSLTAYTLDVTAPGAEAAAVVCGFARCERLHGQNRPPKPDEGRKEVAPADERDVLKLHRARLHRR